MTMREILFRGKSKKDGKWLEGMLTKDQKGHFRIQYDPSCFSVIVIPETIGQFTGIYDKNGNKIFEEDIAKSEKGSIDEVSYDSITFNLLVAQALSPEGTCVNFFGKNNPLIEIEVIGNIHDNPELLK